MANLIVQEALDQLEQLPEDLQMRALTFIGSLSQPLPPSQPLVAIQDLVGSISEDDLQAMLEAVEDCFRVDDDGW